MKIKHKNKLLLKIFASFFALLFLCNSGSVIAQEKDIFIRPFASNSIWNTPIGSNARYQDAGFPYTKANALDPAYFLKLKASDPLRDHVILGSWRQRCSGTRLTGEKLNLPNGYTIPDARQNENGSWATPNNGWEFLLPDGKTLYTSGGGARCSGTGPIFGHGGIKKVSVFGDGLRGGHGASRLPRLGGAIRPGELSSSSPINHPLDLVLYTKYAYSDNKKTWESTFRWPASGADAYALDPQKTDRYIGKNPEVRMGSLLALHPNIKYSDLNITSFVGKKLFDALKNWGGYFTDDSAWNANYLTVDKTAFGTFRWGDTEKQEFGRMIDALSVITNNSPNSIGGGGSPRVSKVSTVPSVTIPTNPVPITNPTNNQNPIPSSPKATPEINETSTEEYIPEAGNAISGVSARASSQVSGRFAPKKAIDGNETDNFSRWSSERRDNEWLEIDLGDVMALERMAILWAGNTTKNYKVEYSSNGKNFSYLTSGNTDNQKFTLRMHEFSNKSARYVRITGLSRWNQNFGNSIREVSFYRSSVENVTTTKENNTTKTIYTDNKTGIVIVADKTIGKVEVVADNTTNSSTSIEDNNENVVITGKINIRPFLQSKPVKRIKLTVNDTVVKQITGDELKNFEEFILDTEGFSDGGLTVGTIIEYDDGEIVENSLEVGVKNTLGVYSTIRNWIFSPFQGSITTSTMDRILSSSVVFVSVSIVLIILISTNTIWDIISRIRFRMMIR